MRGELHLLTDVITAKEWPTYIQKIEKMKPLLVGYVSVPAITLTQWDALKEELRLLDELARKGKKASKLATPTQTRAEAKQITLTAQLESGRLEPAMRAEALRARGVQLDILGKETLAAADFDEALKLLPDNASIQSSAAVNAFVRGQYPDALAHAEQALQLNPSDTSPHRVNADALYVSGDYAGAKSDLLALLDSRAEIENSYAALKLYLTARQLGKDGIDAVKSYLPTDPNPAWPYPVLQFFISAADYGQAQAAAKEEASDPSRLCELYYYVGEKYLLEGKWRLAREYFQKSIGTGVIEFTECALSRQRLAEMAIR